MGAFRIDEAGQHELLKRACGHINDFLIALRRVVAFLDHGVPGHQLRSAKGEAEKHIEAAILKHVYELSNTEIAREMGQHIVGEQKDKNDPATVRQWVKLGTKLLEKAMPETAMMEYRWSTHVMRMKAEARRWNSLTEEEQESEAFLRDYAESRRIRLELARKDLQDFAQGRIPLGLTRIQRWLLENAQEALLPEDDYLAAQERRIERVLETWPPDDDDGRDVLRRSLDRVREDRRTAASGRQPEDGLPPAP